MSVWLIHSVMLFPLILFSDIVFFLINQISKFHKNIKLIYILDPFDLLDSSVGLMPGVMLFS